MSWLPPSDVPSPAADAGKSDLTHASLVRLRGAPLLDALERHAPGSRAHAEATATYAFATAVELGFRRGRAELVRETAKLHDIGKVYVPKDALARPTAELSAEEVRLLGSHVEAGARLAHGAGIPDPAGAWILAVGERFDGGGRRGLGGNAIPVEARIIRGACACDVALAAPPKPPLSSERRSPQRLATDALRDAAGNELDPGVVDALVAVLERSA
jgi:HD-GYP domain-containing protein (c-di-GMP phosphodiesterase class II)